MQKHALALLVCGLLLNGCSSSSTSDTTTQIQTAQASFMDSRVEGLNYSSGGQSGITDTNGQFSYEVGQSVNFSLGNIVIGGGTPSDGLLFAADLSSDATSVANIGRFLQMLDSDGDASNGITISQAVRDSAANGTGWPASVDFTDPSFEIQQAIIEIASLVASIDIAAGTLPSVADANAHQLSTLWCQYGGAFTGTFSTELSSVTSPTQATPSGSIALTLDIGDGKVRGSLFDETRSTNFNLSGNESGDQSLNYARQFTAYLSNSQFAHQGNFDNLDNLSGTWIDNSSLVSGTFNASRVGSSGSSLQRYTAYFDDGAGTNLGFYSIEIGSDNKTLSGIAYTYDSRTLSTVSGSYFASTSGILGSLSDGTSFSATITGSNLSGNWALGSTLSGNLNGSGCSL